MAIILGCSLQAIAQVNIAGRVTDESSKEPVEFATILM